MDPTAEDSSSLSGSSHDKEERLHRREHDRARRASDTDVQREEHACSERETGPGALPRAKKNEPVFYCTCAHILETERPAKLQRRGNSDYSGSVPTSGFWATSHF